MTREERHIAVLNRMLESMDVYDSIQPTTERKKAIKAAIQALSQEPTDRIEYGTDGNAYKLWISNGKEFEQEPCDDAVSRQAVDDYIVKLLDGYLYDEERTRLEGLCAYLWELPSVTQKTGKWIDKDFRKEEYVLTGKCSVCGRVRILDKFCSYCGAKMESEE